MPLRLMMATFFGGPPPYRFDVDLYSQLVREGEDGKRVVASEVTPEVVFECGPLDGNLGSFDMKTHRITIDVLENFVFSITGDESSPDDLRRRFDERLTGTLAHEGGHWQLQKRHGVVATVEKIGVHAFLFLIGVFSVISIYWAFNALSVDHVLPWLKNWSRSGGILIWAGLHIFALFILLRLVNLYFAFWRALSFAIAYKICYHERFARRFEKRPENDPRWERVIET